MKKTIFLLALTLSTSALATGDRVLALVQRLQPAYIDRDEPPEERLARMRVVADAIRPFSPKLRAALLAKADGETHLARYTLRDCVVMPPGASGNCDRNKRGEIKARSYWQLHAKACPELHALPLGNGSDESVRIAARCAARLLGAGMKRCGTVGGAFAFFAGLPCRARTANIERKIITYRKLGGT